MSNFNLCPVVWHFRGEVNTKKIEQIQEHVFRFIYENYNSPYEILLSFSNVLTIILGCHSYDNMDNIMTPSLNITIDSLIKKKVNKK